MILGNKILIGATGGGTDFTTNLVASWQFENNFNDYTGNHNATATGTVTNNTSGKVGNQADFGGETDYLTAPDHDDFSFLDAFFDPLSFFSLSSIFFIIVLCNCCIFSTCSSLSFTICSIKLFSFPTLSLI